MKKILLLLVFAAGFNIISCSLLAQQSTEASERINYKHGLGMAAGFTTGFGLSYRYCPSRFSVQATFAPIKTDYSVRVSAGIAFLYNLVETNRTSFYLYEGNHYQYHKENYDPYGYNSPGVSNNHLSNGVGIGIEFIIYKRISFNLMAGYASYDFFDEINVTGETGLYYKF
jgi:hypothetical protein